MIDAITTVSEVPSVYPVKTRTPQPEPKQAFDTLLQKAIQTREAQQNAVSQLQTTLSNSPNGAAMVAQLFPDEIQKQKKKTRTADTMGDLSDSDATESETTSSPAKAMSKGVQSALSLLNEDPQAAQPLKTGAERSVPIQTPLRDTHFQEQLAQATPQSNQDPFLAQQTPAPQKRLTPQNINQDAGTGTGTTPFQVFLEKAVDFFESVSNMENKSDQMMADYVDGKVSLEELTLIRTKTGIAVTFALTLLNQTTQTFKEVQNMQV